MSTRRKCRSVPALARAVAEPLEVRRLLAADLVISEFMASNSKTLKDQAGDYPDWIEIHNAGDADADLGNYFLTDSAGNPEKWRFPEQTLAAGAYLVVFADSENIAVAGQELHTNFNLAASGEYLGLINATDDSVQFAYAPSYPVQSADVSYGLSNSDDPNSAEVYFSVPTPGQPNAPSVAEPTFSQAGTVFTGTLVVSLSDATPGSVIHYTTNDTTPTATSPTYTGPISLTRSEAIRAMATASGLVSSPVVSQTYERVDSTVTGVANENLPVIIIDTYGATINDTADVAGSATVMNTVNGATNILGAADYQGRIGIHIRGSTSESYPKQQYLLNLWDENNNGKKVSLLGMPADDSWVLYAPYTELSLMQNQLAYEWANQTGHYASRTQFVEVYMSTAGNSYAANTTTINYASNYMGVYILEEKVKADSGRVNIDEMSASNPNGGFIIEQDRYTGEDYFTTPQGVHLVLDDPDDTTLEGNISGAWDAFENALFTGSAGPSQPWDTPGNADYYGNYIDINSFADYFILEEMTRNVDAFWLSTYYTKAADTVVNGAVTQRGLISAGPVWDFNLALGATNYNLSADAEGFDTYLLSPYPGQAGVSGFNPQDPYFQRLLTDPNFVQAVTDRWDQLRQGVFSTANLDADIQSDVNLLSDNTGVYPVGTSPTGTTSPLMRNFQKWPELGVFVTTDAMYDPAGSWIKDVGLMENWLTARVNWMDSQFNPEPTITPGGDFASPVSVTMSPVGPATETDTQLIGPNSSVQYLIPTSTNHPTNWYLSSYVPTGWSTGTTGLGFTASGSGGRGGGGGTGGAFGPYISTNVQTAMQNVSSSIYTRMTFTVSDPSAIQALILKVQYDDGFIAWVNGVRIMDANSPEDVNPTYTTAAASSGDDSQAITYREFDITAIKGMLVAGTNTLAIQGLNVSKSDSDFLLSPTLYSRTYTYPTEGTVYYTADGSDPRTSAGGVSASALIYSGALSLSSSTEIKARTYYNGAWGGLADQDYDFQAGNLRITELMYDPPAGGAYTAQEYEFVELQNTSNVPLNLDGYAFTNGVSFTFPDETLAPGAYGVVVKDPAAFASRYGNSPNVLGVYSGSFDNSGEKVELDDGFGNDVESFHYQPTWYPSTTGGGPSMVVVDPTGDPSALGAATGWRASYANDGAPGYADTNSTTPVVASWSANDGATGSPTLQFTFNTYISAGSPASFTVVNQQTGQPVNGVTASFDGDTVTFSLPAALVSGVYQFTLPAGSIVNASDIANSAATIDTILLIRAGQTWAMPPTENGLVINRLTLGAGSTLDLGNNTLSVEYDNGTDPAGSIASLLASGNAAGAWTGTGIVSSASASDTSNTTGVGYFDDGTKITIARTWYGDTNLDGVINADDLSLMMLGQSNTGTRWQDGNFNYDPQVDADDWIKLMYALSYSQGQKLNLGSVVIAASIQKATQSVDSQSQPATHLQSPAFGQTPINPDDPDSELLDSLQSVL